MDENIANCGQPPDDCLLQAAKYGYDIQLLRLLVDQGANVNAQDAKGNTALANAVAYPHCVDFLLKQDADANATDNEGSSPLMKAVIGGHVWSVRYLLQGGCLVNIRNMFGYTALIQAACYKQVECLRILLQHGVELNTVDKAGNSALVHAVAQQSRECVWLLLQAGVIISRNVFESMYGLIKTWQSTVVDKEILLMLVAGGADQPRTREGERCPFWRNLRHCFQAYVPDENQSLRQLCRTTIRNHLLKTHNRKNLYATISQLELPHLLHSYLLYYAVLPQ